MNSKIVDLAKQAGFALWGNERHKPPNAVVDWSCQYDKELEAFYYLAVEDAKEQGAVSDAAYRAWRRREAYGVPVTEEGQQKAEERLIEFNKGFVSGMKAAMLILEHMHRENKHQHNFYLFAKNNLEEKLKENKHDNSKD